MVMPSMRGVLAGARVLGAALLVVAVLAAASTTLSTRPVLLDQPTLQEVRDYEAAFDSRPAPVPAPESDAAVGQTELRRQCPPSRQRDLTARVHYHRPSTTLPPARVRYFASADSLVHCVSYTWDESHTMSGREMVDRLSQGGVDPDTVIARYDTAFDEVMRSIRQRLGPPETVDPQPIRDTNGTHTQYRRSARWSTERVEIDLALNVSLLGGQIRVDQYWKR